MTSTLYEETAASILQKDAPLRALSTEGGAAPDGFREPLDLSGTKRATSKDCAQLHEAPHLTGCLWLDFESGEPDGQDKWGRSPLVSQAGQLDEWAWASILPDFRTAAEEASSEEGCAEILAGLRLEACCRWPTRSPWRGSRTGDR
ncbi:hypothetical protein [Myxococcus faecalis]|uniref:hypothetical protein n=1 Tax=Myxococcus faecalis TaxID=3115646 RepID=UPI003CEFBF5B